MSDRPTFTAAEVRLMRDGIDDVDARGPGTRTLSLRAILDAYAARLEQDEEVRAEGRREILALIPEAFDREDRCAYCQAKFDIDSGHIRIQHTPDCLWLRATSLPTI